MAPATDLLRPRLTLRKASFTVSLIVSVPSCALAALSASSSMSTRCFATSSVYTIPSFIYTASVERSGLAHLMCTDLHRFPGCANSEFLGDGWESNPPPKTHQRLPDARLDHPVPIAMTAKDVYARRDSGHVRPNHQVG